MTERKRTVMCVDDWPEAGEDFVVFAVRDGETDEQAIERAKKSYSPDSQFYIVEACGD